MIRAGDLDRTITLKKDVEVLDAYGAPSESATAQTLTTRAMLLDNGSDDEMQPQGAATVTTLTFRTWFVAWLAAGDRLEYQGDEYLIKKLSEIGRKRALEIKAERQGAL